jgi:superfamily II DNA or RNA helicase
MTKTKKVTSLSIVSNATVAKLVDAPRDAQIKVAEILSYHAGGYDKSSLGRKQGWDSRKSFYSFKSHTFPAGFARTVVGRLTKQGYKVNWVKRPLPTPLGDKRPVVDSFGYSDPRYQYQPETADKLVRYGQMIAHIATGGGKSRIARICYKRIHRKTLFLTTRGVLMYQMRDNFADMLGEEVGVVGDGVWSPVDGFNVGMVQTLASTLEKKNFDDELERVIEIEDNAIQRKVEAHKRKLKNSKSASPQQVMLAVKKYRDELYDKRPADTVLIKQVQASVQKHNARRERTIAFLKDVEFLILEEAHEAGSNEYYNVCMACKNAHYRLSLTATPFMRGEEEANMRLMAVSGPTGISITEKMLIDWGVLATPKFYFVKVPKPTNLYRTTAWTGAQKIGITDNDWRNDDIVSRCVNVTHYGLTSMALVLRKEHGRTLKKLMQKQGLRVSYIDGDNSQAERKEALRKLGAHEIDVLIGSTILDVGVDVPSVGQIILAGGGKAEIAMRQRIGRGLRAKQHGPNICIVIDYCDRHNTHLTKHAVARRKIIEETPGFAENIVDVLRLEDYGFTRIARTKHSA